MRWALAALAFLAGISGALAAEPTTTYNGTVTNPNGDTAGAGTVSCTISDPAATYNDGGPQPVTSPRAGTINGSGVLSLVLTPNDLITPAATTWECAFTASDMEWRERWMSSDNPDPVAYFSAVRQAGAGKLVYSVYRTSSAPARDSACRSAETPYHPSEGFYCYCINDRWYCGSQDIRGDGLMLKPDENLDGTGSIEVYGLISNRDPVDSTNLNFDANGDDLWDVALADNGTTSGIRLRNGFPFIQFGSAAKLKVKLCTTKIEFFYDNDDDGNYDAATDFCWGNGGYDSNCDCSADAGAGGGDMYQSTYDADTNSVVDAAESLTDFGTFAARTVDSDGNGTADLSVTAGGVGGTAGDGTNPQRWCVFPGGYSSDPFDYTSGFCVENQSSSGDGAFYPIVSDPNYATLGSTPRADLGSSTYKWKNGYFNGILSVATATFNNLGYANTYESNPVFWNSGGGQVWKTDSDYDDSATRKYDWTWQTGVATTVTAMHLDGDATPEFWIDVNGDGTKDIRFDGADNPAHGESLTWDGTASAARWTAGGGGGDDLAVDGTATASATPNLDDGGDINFAYAAPNITATVKADSVALGTDTTGNYAGSSSEGGAATTASALAADPSDCSANQYANAIAANGNLTCATPRDIISFVWHYENAPASGTNYMTPSDTTSMVNLVVPVDATFYALSCANNATISAGTLTFAATYGAGPTTSDLTVQQTTSTAAFAGIQDTACTTNCSVSAGTRIRISIVAAGTVAPTTTDPSCTLLMTIP